MFENHSRKRSPFATLVLAKSLILATTYKEIFLGNFPTLWFVRKRPIIDGRFGKGLLSDVWGAAQSEIILVCILSTIYHPRNNSEDFEDIIGIADPEDDEEDDDDEPEEASKKWHHKLLKSASGVLRGQESPSQCVNEQGGAEAEDSNGLLDSLDEDLFSTSSVSSPLMTQPPSNPASSLTNSLILAMTLILIMHAMIANLWNALDAEMVVMHIELIIM